MNFKAILVATDFSECAGAAFKVAKSLGQQFGAKIVVLHVIQQRIVARLAEHLKVEPDTLLPAFREEAQLQLDAFLKEGCCNRLEVTSMVTVGIPFQEIAVVARALGKPARYTGKSTLILKTSWAGRLKISATPAAAEISSKIFCRRSSDSAI